MTITTPWRRTILQRSQRALTDAETFTRFLLLESIRDPAAREVVGRQLDAHPIAGQNADEVHPQLAADVRQDAVFVLQFDIEHVVGQRLDDRTLDFDRVLLGHRRRQAPSFAVGGGWTAPRRGMTRLPSAVSGRARPRARTKNVPQV